MKRLVLVMLGIVVLASACIPSQLPAAAESPSEQVWDACVLYIADQTGVNFIMEGWEYSQRQVVELAPGRYAVSIFDEAVSMTYLCEVTWRPSAGGTTRIIGFESH